MNALNELAIVIALNALAFWQRNTFLYLLIFVINMVYGLALTVGEEVYSTMWMLGVAVAVVGTFCLFRVAVAELLPRIKRRVG